MGWWTIEDTDDLVGDDAFSLLRTATRSVTQLYLREHGRIPTRSEWEALFKDAMDPKHGAMVERDGHTIMIDVDQPD